MIQRRFDAVQKLSQPYQTLWQNHHLKTNTKSSIIKFIKPILILSFFPSYIISWLWCNFYPLYFYTIIYFCSRCLKSLKVVFLTFFFFYLMSCNFLCFSLKNPSKILQPFFRYFYLAKRFSHKDYSKNARYKIRSFLNFHFR